MYLPAEVLMNSSRSANSVEISNFGVFLGKVPSAILQMAALQSI
jgi:hypothetical protein